MSPDLAKYLVGGKTDINWDFFECPHESWYVLAYIILIILEAKYDYCSHFPSGETEAAREKQLGQGGVAISAELVELVHKPSHL